MLLGLAKVFTTNDLHITKPSRGRGPLLWSLISLISVILVFCCYTRKPFKNYMDKGKRFSHRHTCGTDNHTIPNSLHSDASASSRKTRTLAFKVLLIAMTGPSCQPIIRSGQAPDHVVVWGDTVCRITSPLWRRCFLQHFPSAGLLLWDPAAGLLCDTAMGQLLATKGKHVQDLRDTVRLVRLLLATINTEEHPKASLLRMSGSWIALLGSLETPASVTFWGYIDRC